jgi:beta-lactamase regulating signal transducer with metallopeptidase domain
MTFKQKNITASLISFMLILGFYLIRVFQMLQNNTFEASNLFWLWGIVIVLAVIGTIVAIIFTQIVTTVSLVIQTGKQDPKINDLEDERDKLIDLRGTQVTYTVYSLGVFVAMLTFVIGQPPLVMFALLIFFGVVAQIIGDTTRLILYQRGF